MAHHTLAVLAVTSLLVGGCATRQPVAESAPPLRVTIGLGASEITRVAAAVRAAGRVPATSRFVSVGRVQTGKDAPSHTPTKAMAVVYNSATQTLTEVTVDLASGAIVQVTPRQGEQPRVLEEDFDTAIRLTRDDPEWQAAMGKRGITNFKNVLIDGWAPGERAPGGVADGTRVLRTLSYDISNLRDAINPYSQPIEGVEVIVDIDHEKVVKVHDHGVVPRPANPTPTKAETRANLKPLVTSQPDGPSFRIRGDAIEWGHWRLRIEFHPRDGLILRDIGWADGGAGGKVRPILASAMLSEMVVPYGDPSGSWRWRSAFDSGEYGLGNSTRTLTPGREVPENAAVLPGCVVTSNGTPKEILGAVAIYERDGGLGWLHYDYLSSRVESARERELWLTSIVTIGNYDYGVNWIFRETGAIEVQAMLTGILLPKGTAAHSCSACDAVVAGISGQGTGDQKFGTLIAPGVVAPNHQHWFNFRLDFDVDGRNNSVLEMNTASAGPGAENPSGNAFVMSETLLRTERDAKREVSTAAHRLWRVVNPSVRNSLGHLSGYVLVPGGNGVPYSPEGSPLLHDAGFVRHHLWVTREKSDELHAAGDYPNQTRGGEGLPKWSTDESITNTDVVVWYNFAVTHTPRAEEWPVMSTERAGFRLLPKGFFERNPAYHPE